ncbi:hypothetical protein LTR85_003614 [Meristemomyces frigidus]|nr:hypothetical protein LTR85_003614 [Meristemomyces frigidus]
MDRFSPVVPAAIRVHVLPIGKIQRNHFQSVLNKLQRCAAIIELADLPEKDEHLLSPKGSPQGSLLFNYTTFPSSEQERQLSPYELFREPLLVLGIASGLSNDGDKHEAEVKEAARYLRERHPRVVHRHILLLETGERRPSSVNNVTAVGESDASDGPALRAAMCEAAAQFLVEFTTYTKALQVSPTVQTPGQTSRASQRAVPQRGDERRPESGYATPTQSTAVSSPTGDDHSRPPSRGFGSPPPATSFEQVQRASNAPNALARSDSNTSNRSGQNGDRASSRNRVSVHGFGPSTSKEKDKNRGKARVGIVIGHVHLMAGQWREALRMLVEHTNVARKISDSIWHGKGLEGILVCMLLLAWAGIEFSIPSVCFPTAERSRSLHAAKLSVNLPADFRPAEVAYQAAVGRLSTSLPDLLNQISALYRSGEGSLELLPLVVCEVKVRFSELLATMYAESGELNGNARTRIVERSATRPGSKPSAYNASTSLTKNIVATMLAEAQPNEDDNLAPADHIQILAGIASVYSSLGMARKKGLALKDMVDRLTAALIQARKVGAAEAGIHPAASLSADTGADSIVDIATESGGVNNMVDEIAEIYGINLLPGDEDDSEELGARRLVVACQGFGNEMLKETVMQALIDFCEASPDPKGVLRTAISLLRSATADAALDYKPDAHRDRVISKDDQARLAAIISRTVGISRHLGLADIQADYWDPHLVRRIDFIAPDAARATILRSPQGPLSGPAKQGAPANPLLYDPNASRPGSAAEARLLMVRNEPMSCVVTLQNPLEVSVKVESVALTADRNDVKLETQGFTQMALDPLCFKQVSISVSPTSVGDFNITGCRIRVAGCREQLFRIGTLPWARSAELLVKHHGQGARNAFTAGPDAESMILPVTAIDAMPLLELESISAVESRVMLLDGERQELNVTVRNASAHTSASIMDVTEGHDILRLKDAQMNNLSSDPVDRHPAGLDEGGDPRSPDEHEHDQSVGEDVAAVATLRPSESALLRFDVVGRLGVTEVTLDIVYQRSPAQKKDTYARLLTVPVHVTIDASLDAQLVDVTNAQDEGFIFTFDLRNAWSKPIAYCVDVWRAQEEKEDEARNETLLAVGEIHRVAERFERMPSVGLDEALADVRQDLLRRLKVSWRTWAGDARWGEVDLGRLDFTAEHLEVMRERTYSMRLDIVKDGKTPPKPGSFVTIRATLKFDTPLSGPLWLELQSPLEKRSLGLIGVSHRILPPLQPGEEAHVDFSLCPMMPGLLELDAYARPAMPSAQGAAGGKDWHTERPLLVKVG